MYKDKASRDAGNCPNCNKPSAYGAFDLRYQGDCHHQFSLRPFFFH